MLVFLMMTVISVHLEVGYLQYYDILRTLHFIVLLLNGSVKTFYFVKDFIFEIDSFLFFVSIH